MGPVFRGVSAAVVILTVGLVGGCASTDARIVDQPAGPASEAPAATASLQVEPHLVPGPRRTFQTCMHARPVAPEGQPTTPQPAPGPDVDPSEWPPDHAKCALPVPLEELQPDRSPGEGVQPLS